jgi:hypothetical protein
MQLSATLQAGGGLQMSGQTELLWSENVKPVESLARSESPPSNRVYDDAYSAKAGCCDLLVNKKQENGEDITKTFGNVCLDGCNCRGGSCFDYRQPDGQLYDYRRYVRGAFVGSDDNGAVRAPSFYGGYDQGYYGSCNGDDTYSGYGGYGRYGGFGRGGLSSVIGALPYLIGQGGNGGFSPIGGIGAYGLGMVLRTLPNLLGRGGLGGLFRWRR